MGERFNMTYWLDLFTGETWKQFREQGATVSGFRKTMEKYKKQPQPGDILICYLTGVMRWIGALEVLGRSDDKSAIWKVDEFPYRFAVKPLVLLDPEFGVPMEHLVGRVDFYQGPDDRGGFKGFLRMSPNYFRREKDAQLIVELLRQAEHHEPARLLITIRFRPNHATRFRCLDGIRRGNRHRFAHGFAHGIGCHVDRCVFSVS